MVALGAATAISLVLLARVELRAAQPILPPDLFRNHVYVIGVTVIGLAGMALFAAVVFLPLMFQLLLGASPSRAGLMIAPMMGGVIVSSVGGGRLVSTTGRYKLLPVLGLLTVSAVFATFAWATRTAVPQVVMEVLLVAMGLGMGLVLPTLTTAIQNAVLRGELGAATATAAFFRSLGGAVGVALSGAVLASYLHRLPLRLQEAAGGVGEISRLSAADHAAVLGAYRIGLSGAFAAGASIASLAFLTVLFLPELPLRRGTAIGPTEP